MLLLILEAENNYHVEAPILLQKNSKLHNYYEKLI